MKELLKKIKFQTTVSKIQTLNSNLGITLVALVVTIVVLLILAGITIGNLVNKDIINLTKESGNKANSEVDKTLSEIEKLRNELAEGIEIENTEGGSGDTTVKITEVSFSPNTAAVIIGGTITLTPGIEPANASNKTLKWTSLNTDIAVVDSNGVVTGVKAGTATITAEATDESGKSATCTVTVTQPININKDTMTSDNASWEALERVAKSIAKGNAKDENNKAVSSDSLTATGKTEQGENYTINVGDEFKVKYNENERSVIVLGFNHDNLCNTSAYGEGTTVAKAGITFQFKGFMTDDHHVMCSNNKNTNGWGGTAIRTYLEGTNGIGKLNIQSQIKQVKKKYLLGNQSTTVIESNDKLWLLSCSEIFSGPTSSNTGGYGWAKEKEGERYKYYKNLKETDTSGHSGLIKKTSNGTGSVSFWWLRSPLFSCDWGFCGINKDRKFWIYKCQQ